MRYIGEVKFYFVGSREECVKYIPDARKVLGMLRTQNRELGRIPIAFRRVVLPNGVVIEANDNTVLPVLKIIAGPVPGTPPPEPDISDVRLAWQPEGIVFTPVSDAYPTGFGLPTRDQFTGERVPDERGTPGGILPQVIINRFPNNKYLDQPDAIAGATEEVTRTYPPINYRLRTEWDEPVDMSGQYANWQFLYDPLSVGVPPTEAIDPLYWLDEDNQLQYPQRPGIYRRFFVEVSQAYVDDSTPLQLQYEERYESLVYEPESEEWFTHRAEELLYLTPAHEAIFQKTNEYRLDVGEGPMHRQLRGHANTARNGVTEVAISQKQFHDSDDFRFGYRQMRARAQGAQGRNLAAENLQINQVNTGNTWDDGVGVAESWKASPSHYANMIAPFWTDQLPYGAEHTIANAPAVVDDTVTYGPLDPPLAGMEWGQVFTKYESWLPVPSAYHEGTLGTTGWYGKSDIYGRDDYVTNPPIILEGVTYLGAYPFVVYQGHIYEMRQFDGDDTFMGVFGVGVYHAPVMDGLDVVGQQLRMRAVVCFSQYVDPPVGYIPDPATSDLTYKVFTAPVVLTDDVQAEWVEEASITFLEADNWINLPEGGVRFALDGTKFLFSMLKRGPTYTDALDYNASNFNTEISPLLNPRVSVELHHYEYEGGTFTMIHQPALPDVLITATTTNAGMDGETNLYDRTLVATVDMFSDYDEGGNVIYATAIIDEDTHQLWTRDDGGFDEAESEGYRYRALQFPSGKTVIYHQQYFENAETIEDMADVEARGWPGAWDGNYTKVLHSLNVREEVVTYSDVGASQTMFLGSPNGGPQQNFSWQHGARSIQHEDIVMYSIPDPFDTSDPNFVDGWIIVVYIYPYLIQTTANPSQENVSIEGALGIYNMELATYRVDLAGSLVISSIFPTPNLDIGVAAGGGGVSYWYRGAYNGYPQQNVDSLYGRPPHQDVKASIAPGLGGGENLLYWGSSGWAQSFQTCNIAPLMTRESEVECKVAKYRTRTLVRWDENLPPVPDILYDYLYPWIDPMPPEIDVLIGADFDIDEAAGMTGVTDIEPFGRIG